MSRTSDIAYIESQIQALNVQRHRIAEDFNVYRQQIGAQVERILRDAGVWDIVQTLEKGREQRRIDDQARVDALAKEIAELERVRAFLQTREASDAAATETPATGPTE